MNFVAAVVYHFCLALPAAFTQPGTRLLAEPCTLLLLWRTFLCPISGGGVGKTPLPLIFCLSSLLKKASHAIQPLFKALCLQSEAGKQKPVLDIYFYSLEIAAM